MYDNHKLEKLLKGIGKLSRLKNLDVQGCSTLKALPDSMGELVELSRIWETSKIG
jgi:hypothetical protein